MVERGILAGFRGNGIIRSGRVHDQNNGFKEGTGTKILLDAIETATPLESNKSHAQSIPGQDALPCAFEAVLDSPLFVTLPEPTGVAMSLHNTLGSACIGLAACARA